MAEVIGPGGGKRKCNHSVGKSEGPGGPGGNGADITTKRGYEAKRFSGLRTTYRETGRAENGKATK